jgi:ribosome biogenesis GTPase
MTLSGLIIKSTGSWYKIRQADTSIIDARIKGKIRLKTIKTTNPVAVGDWVDYELESSGDETYAVITQIHARNNYIIRKSNNLSKQAQIIASNLDLAVLVVTLSAPRTSLGFIDRFLVMAGAYHIPVCLVFNKCDLYNSDDVLHFEHLKALYEPLGYQCLMCSTIDANYSPNSVLKSVLQHKTSLISGHSGVGKSSILNQLLPLANQKTNSISDSHQKGKHTTTFAEMFFIDSDSALIDTPGIRDFGIIDLEKTEIGHYFPEIRAYMPQCKFNDCTHQNEPECAVFKAFEAGQIAGSRYYNYLSILDNQDIFE